jgi:hypothetical protein
VVPKDEDDDDDNDDDHVTVLQKFWRNCCRYTDDMQENAHTTPVNASEISVTWSSIINILNTIAKGNLGPH